MFSRGDALGFRSVSSASHRIPISIWGTITC